MKKICTLITIFLYAHFTFALDGGYDTYVFMSANGKPYVEIYYWVSGNKIDYVPVKNDKKQGKLEFTFLISDIKSQDKVYSYNKFNYETKSYFSSDSIYSDFYYVQRLELPSDKSILEIFIKDLNNEKNKIEILDTIIYSKTPGDYFQSNIMFIEKYASTDTAKVNAFSKVGYDMLPFHFSTFTTEDKKLSFYSEIHDIDKYIGKGGKYIVQSYLESSTSNLQLENFSQIKRYKAEPFTPMLLTFNINDLKTGQYNVVVEIRDSLNRFLSRSKRTFYKESLSNELVEENFVNLDYQNNWVNKIPQDSLEDILKSMFPIAGANEIVYIKNVLKSGDEGSQKRLIAAFWENRYPYDAERQLGFYRNVVAKVNEDFASPGYKGYESPRGRVFLKYGAPNVMSQRPSEPDTYPYEIWSYYKLKSQTNVRFVFADTDLNNSYILLHSDLRGEIQNRNWGEMLRNRMNTNGREGNVDPNNTGNWQDSLYRLPR